MRGLPFIAGLVLSLPETIALARAGLPEPYRSCRTSAWFRSAYAALTVLATTGVHFAVGAVART